LKGITGHDCGNCPPRHIITADRCCSCEENCTGLLLDDIEILRVLIEEANLTDVTNLPWTRLLHLINRLNKIKKNINDYQYLISKAQQIVGNITISFDFETLADILYSKSRELNTRAAVISREAKSVKDEAQALLDIFNDLWELIIDTVNQLRKHCVDPNDPIGHSGRILKEAERILREIQTQDFRTRAEEADRELRNARNLLDRVRQLLTDNKHTGPLKERLDRLEFLLSDILSIVQQKVELPIQTAVRLVQELRPNQRFVLEAIENSTSYADVANTTLVEARALLESAKNALIETGVKYNFLPRLLDEVNKRMQLIEERISNLSRLNPEYTEKYVIPCQQNAEDLMRQVLHLISIFNATRGLAEYPLQAAQVYQKIVDALVEAEEEAKKAYVAAEKAYKEAYLGTDDSLAIRTTKAKQRSEELLKVAKDIRDNSVPHLERELEKKRYRLDVIADNMTNGKINLELIKSALDMLPKDLSGVLLEGVNAKLRNISEGLKETHQRIDDIDGRIAAELMPKLNGLIAETTPEIENLTKIIDQTRNDIRNASTLADSAEKIAQRVNGFPNQIKVNIEELKNRILIARQKAASIRVSLGTDKSGVCLRSYEPNIQPSISNNIILNYAIKEEVRDSLLFFIGSNRTDDFMAIEMVDRKIIFLWNVGGGTKMLSHILNIDTNDEQLLKDNKWYKIEVNRIGNVATLTVKRIPDANKPDPFEISDSSTQGFNRMDLNRDSYFFVGELPDNFRAPPELRSRSFAGCLYELTLDEKQVGLWNFTTNKGCGGCKEGATEPIDPSTFQFKGEDSYVILNQIKRYYKTQYSVSLQFKTFDEEALLFFTANQLTGDFISLTLKDGKVTYQFKMGTSGGLSLTTKNKYNSGRWVRIDAEREQLDGVLFVGDEDLEGRAPSGSQTTLELSDSELYFGGVTPNFTTHRWPSVVFKPFFGCIKNAQIDTTPLNLLQMEAFRVETGCRDEYLQVVSFKGNGYLQLNSEPLREEADFSFTFKTTQSHALLLLSTFEGTNDPTDRDSVST
jgi:laminin alpha 1/2